MLQLIYIWGIRLRKDGTGVVWAEALAKLGKAALPILLKNLKFIFYYTFVSLWLCPRMG